MSLMPRVGRCFHCGHDHGDGLLSPDVARVLAAGKSDKDRIAELESELAALRARLADGERQEPVATVIKKGAERQWMSERLGNLPDGMYSLFLAPPTAATIRAEAMEEAAKVCEEHGEYWHAEKDAALLNDKVDLSNAMSGDARAGRFLAAAIRKLAQEGDK